MSSPKHDSPKYGRYYTAEEVVEIFAPSQATVNPVREWLVSAGIPAEKISQSVNKQWMQFDASTSSWNLCSKPNTMRMEILTGKTTVACEKYDNP
jgi:tripeptidyl-peptidase I